MNNSDRIEILNTIATIHRQQFDERRRYEWRVLFSTLGIFAALLVEKITGKLNNFTECNIQIIFSIISIVLITISSIYLCHIHRANSVNKGIAQVAENELMALSGVKEKFDKEISMKPKCKRWAIIWQIATIALFAFTTLLIFLCN